MARAPAPKRRFPAWLPGMMISAIALTLAIWGVKPGRLLVVLEGAQYGYLVPAIAALIVGLAARSMSWKQLLKGRLSWRTAFEALNVGYLLNTILPLRLGELGRAYLIRLEAGVPIGHAIASVITERLIDAGVSLSGLLAALPFIVGAGWVDHVTLTVGIAFIAAALGMILLSSNRSRLTRLFLRLPRKGPLRILAATDDFLGGLEEMFQFRILTFAGFWSLTAWITTWIQLHILFRLVGLETDWVAYLFVSGITAFGAGLPSSPGAVGVFELSVVAAMRVLGYSPESGLSVAILWHGLQVLITALVGSWALLAHGRRAGEIAEHARSLVKPEVGSAPS